MAKTRKKIFEKEPPLLENLEEANILGSMIKDKVFMFWCFKYQTTEDLFEHEEAKKLFNVIKAVKSDGDPVDILTISEKSRILGFSETLTPVLFVKIEEWANVIKAYASMKKRIKDYGLKIPIYNLPEEQRRAKKDEYNVVVDFEINLEFRRFVERYLMWAESPEIKNSLTRLANPDTSVNDRQFCAGVLYALKKFEAYFDQYIEDENGDLLGITMSDLLNQYDDWKRGVEIFRKQKETAIPSKMNENYDFDFGKGKVRIVIDNPNENRTFPNDDIPF
jgi:hypothetical protein